MGQARRLHLHNMLKDLLGSDNVYFDQPEGRVMEYPCIVYERDNDSVKHADDLGFIKHQRYSVTYIDQMPDSDVLDALRELPLSAYNRHFTTSNLHHDVFVIYH